MYDQARVLVDDSHSLDRLTRSNHVRPSSVHPQKGDASSFSRKRDHATRTPAADNATTRDNSKHACMLLQYIANIT